MNEDLPIKESKRTASIDYSLYEKLVKLGIIDDSTIRNTNVGVSDYSQHVIQPWSIWLDYDLDPFDADIVKRILRKKGSTKEEILKNRRLDYEKILHICQERLRQIKLDEDGEIKFKFSNK